MALISIRERGVTTAGPVVSLDGQEYPITISDPFSEKEEALLEWYFEEHLRFPFVRQVDAREAAESITRYGEALFQQVFADPEAYARYKEGVQAGLDTLRFEIAGSPEFHRFHWEALKDPKLPQALALQAPMVRKNLVPQPVRARVRSSPTINLLIVTARPGGARDVGYRTISRPLVEGLRQTDVPVRVDIVRRGAIKPFLLDQSRVAGIGNVTVQDPLFRAGIHPLRPINTLSDAQIATLYDAIQHTLREAIEHDGSRWER
ncbi:MAG: hypothetical protein ACE5I2_16720, partial [Anaerolineae bacterium]